MNKKRVITASAVGILSILSVLAIRSDAKPIYLGLIFAFIGIVFIGMFSNKLVSSIIGGSVIGLGYLFRVNFPVTSTLKGDKLAKFLENQAAYNEQLAKYLFPLILLGIAVGFVSGILGEKLNSVKKARFSTNKLTYMGIFIALSVMINTMRVGSISFGGFPIIFSGYLLGPVNGFIVGAIADLVGFLVRPSAFAFNPLFTLTSALTGLIPVLVTNLLGDKYPKFNLVKVLIGIFVGQMLTSVIMVPFFNKLLYDSKDTFYIMMVKAFFKQIVSIPIYAFLITTISDRITKIINFRSEIQ